MRPGESEDRPAGNGPATKSLGSKGDSTAAADISEFRHGYQIGYGTGYQVGYAHGVTDEGAAWTSVMTGCTETWRSPRQAELERLREPDHRPCPARCARCARCIHSMAYWKRGGRDFLGIAAEARLAAGAT